MQRCDLLDVLEYIAYESTPIEREKRVELVKKKYVDSLNKEQRDFDNLILQYYVNNGFKELGSDNLKTFITIKFNSMSDAKERLNMSAADIRAHYFDLQRRLYCAYRLSLFQWQIDTRSWSVSSKVSSLLLRLCIQRGKNFPR